MQLIQQHVASCVGGVESGLGPSGLKIVAVFWASITVSSAYTVQVTHETDTVNALPAGQTFCRLIRYAGKR